MEGASVSAEPAGAESSGAGHTVRFVFVGDVMLARLVDQLFPQHVDEPEDRLHALGLLLRQGGQQALKEVAEKGHSYVWGDTLSLFDPGRSDLRVANLETAATHRSEKWPDKAFNYRMVSM